LHAYEKQEDCSHIYPPFRCSAHGVSCACPAVDALIGYRDNYAFLIGTFQPRMAASAVRQNVTPAKSSGSKFSPRFADDEQQVYNARNTATMAKSKMVTRKQAATAEAPLTTKVANGTPYQLDPTQVERAAKALVSHMKKHAEEKDDKDAVKNLADDEDEAENKDQPIFLSVSTKKHVSNTNSLKPTKMSVQTFHHAQPLF
jgi:hypothetical protein